MGQIAMTCPHAIHHLTVVLNGCVGGNPDKRSICTDGYEDRKCAENLHYFLYMPTLMRTVNGLNSHDLSTGDP